ncbi:hypothetical protein RRG08_036083 [Elysia crispata]|uniref:Uncharacterized protein n=1 Tax=Elysia crispata TaxID=231223 RepID=A0AAE1ALK5_9GAST|nr:hypothetical protein RRG08_036083 [Elysia crispata]
MTQILVVRVQRAMSFYSPGNCHRTVKPASGRRHTRMMVWESDQLSSKPVYFPSVYSISWTGEVDLYLTENLPNLTSC